MEDGCFRVGNTSIAMKMKHPALYSSCPLRLDVDEVLIFRHKLARCFTKMLFKLRTKVLPIIKTY